MKWTLWSYIYIYISVWTKLVHQRTYQKILLYVTFSPINTYLSKILTLYPCKVVLLQVCLLVHSPSKYVIITRNQTVQLAYQLRQQYAAILTPSRGLLGLLWTAHVAPTSPASRCPPIAAECNGTHPSGPLFSSILAPASSKSRMGPTWPRSAAWCKSVLPRWSRTCCRSNSGKMADVWLGKL